MIKQYQKLLNKILVALDIFAIIVALGLAWLIRFKSGFIQIDEGALSLNTYISSLAIIIPIYLITYLIFKLYTPFRIRDLFNEFFSILKANIVAVGIFTFILYLVKNIHYSRILIVIFTILCIVITFLNRMLIRLILRQLRRNGFNKKHIVIIGVSDVTDELLSTIKHNKQWAYNVVGIFDDKILEKNYNGIKILGKLKDLESYLERTPIDEVFITFEVEEYKKISKIIEVCEKVGVRLKVIPTYVKYIPAKPIIEDMDGLTAINMRYVPLDNLLNNLIKRTMDIMISVCALILFSPVMLITIILIKLSSPGPVIFRQERIGLNNRPFTMYKFRSMKMQNDKEEKRKWTTKDDNRKTQIGTVIRKLSVDELPQLFNVLKGEMSLVGPRPERPFYVEQFKEEIPKYMIKHHVRPGITGWAQVNGYRGDTSISKRIEYDIYYIENWTISLDFKILILTIFKGFVNENAY